MIELTYDAMAGWAHRDGLVENTVDAWIALHHDTRETVQQTTSTENALNALRVAVKKGKIAHTDVVIFYNRYNGSTEPVETWQLRVDCNGRLDHWPPGFADLTDRLLEKLIDWNDIGADADTNVG
jgi:predicted ATPase